MTIKDKDFIEVDYTGYLKENSMIFDTTDKSIAKENGLSLQQKYGPVVICVGEGIILKGIETKLIGKELGDYEFDISAEEGFGKKDSKLIQLIPTSKFKQQKINPVPGLQINIDNSIGTIKTVSGGRTIVDFNHPLSGKELHYKVSAKKFVEDLKIQLESILSLKFRFPFKEVKIEGDKAIIITEKEIIEEQFIKPFSDELKKLVKIKEIEFSKDLNSSVASTPKE